jgi:UDP:flavonoid glycosyltransferase YjiC (YdhE family)
VPSIIVPFFGDQYFWAWWAAQHGVGPQAPSRQKLTAAKLAEAIQQATQDDSIKRRASALGALIRAEDGIRKAIEFVEAYMHNL